MTSTVALTPAAIEALVRQALAAALRVDATGLNGQTHFSDFGLDSLLGLRFARRLEDALGCEIDPEWLYDHPTLSSLSAFLASLATNGDLTEPSLHLSTREQP